MRSHQRGFSVMVCFQPTVVSGLSFEKENNRKSDGTILGYHPLHISHFISKWSLCIRDMHRPWPSSHCDERFRHEMYLIATHVCGGRRFFSTPRYDTCNVGKVLLARHRSVLCTLLLYSYLKHSRASVYRCPKFWPSAPLVQSAMTWAS